MSKKRRLVIESSSSGSEAEETKTSSKKTATKKATSPAAKVEAKASAKKTKKAASPSPPSVKESLVAVAEKEKPQAAQKASPKVAKKASPKELKSAEAVKKQEEEAEVVEEVKEEAREAIVVSKKEKSTSVVPAVSSLFSNMKKAGIVSNETSAAMTFKPDKANYHPVKDGCWEKDQPVPYKALAQTFYCMEKTTKRLELLSIVCNYFRSVLALTPKDLVPSMYLLTNKVAPDYENIELGIGDTVLFKALAEATGSTVTKLKTEFHAKGKYF